MKRSLFALVIAVLGGCARFRPAAPPPDWLGKRVFADGDFIDAVGRSQPQDSEKTARQDALDDATGAFVEYCGVGADSFDRAVEAYAMDGDGRERADSQVAARTGRRERSLLRRAAASSWYVVREGGQSTAAVLLRVPKAELERIRREKGVSLAVDLLLYRDDDAGKLRPLAEGEILRTGGGLALYLRPSDDSYVYLYEVDGLGRVFRLFPNPALETGANPLPAGAAAWIPNERGLLNLDATTGKERLYFFAARERIPELEGPSAELTGLDLDAVVAAGKWTRAFLRKKRDAVRISPPQAKRTTLAVGEKLQAEASGPIVYETWFSHL